MIILYSPYYSYSSTYSCKINTILIHILFLFTMSYIVSWCLFSSTKTPTSPNSFVSIFRPNILNVKIAFPEKY